MNLAQAYDTNCITSIKLSPSAQNAGLEKKKLDLQRVLWASSCHILLA